MAICGPSLGILATVGFPKRPLDENANTCHDKVVDRCTRERPALLWHRRLRSQHEPTARADGLRRCKLGGSSADRSSNAVSTEGLLNDGDAEKKNDHDMDNSSANHEDGDLDSEEEYEETDGNGDYHDSDDDGVLGFGHAASATEERAIASLVERYYAVSAARDGAKACLMMAPSTPER